MAKVCTPDSLPPIYSREVLFPWNCAYFALVLQAFLQFRTISLGTSRSRRNSCHVLRGCQLKQTQHLRYTANSDAVKALSITGENFTRKFCLLPGNDSNTRFFKCRTKTSTLELHELQRTHIRSIQTSQGMIQCNQAIKSDPHETRFYWSLVPYNRPEMGFKRSRSLHNVPRPCDPSRSLEAVYERLRSLR